MAIYHVHMQEIQRGAGRNAVAAAAYRSASKLTLTNPYSAFYSVDCEDKITNHLDAVSENSLINHNELSDSLNCGVTVEHEYDYSRKKGVVYSAIHAPDDVAEWMKDREKLWNGAEARETRKNSQTAREFDIALPV